MTGPTAGDLLLLAGAGLAAGTLNGVAGGGTLASFPALLATGLPALRANITSTVGIYTGYLGGVAGFRKEIGEQPKRALRYSVPAFLGALGGAILLLVTPGSAFDRVVPYLVLAAALLFAAQPLLARALQRHRHEHPEHRAVAWTGTFLGSVYGGYFGAGLGVVLLALLGLALPDSLVRTNGLRSMISLTVNTAAAAVFLVHGHVSWPDAGVLAGGSLVGGYGGARLARRLPPTPFRVIVVALGLGTAIKLLVG
jgi:uncharacterized membrane protein YfcA